MLDDALVYELANFTEQVQGADIETRATKARQDLAEWRLKVTDQCEAVRLDWGEGTGRFDAEAECWLELNANQFLRTDLAMEQGIVKPAE